MAEKQGKNSFGTPRVPDSSLSFVCGDRTGKSVSVNTGMWINDEHSKEVKEAYANFMKLAVKDREANKIAGPVLRVGIGRLKEDLVGFLKYGAHATVNQGGMWPPATQSASDDDIEEAIEEAEEAAPEEEL